MRNILSPVDAGMRQALDAHCSWFGSGPVAAVSLISFTVWCSVNHTGIRTVGSYSNGKRIRFFFVWISYFSDTLFSVSHIKTFCCLWKVEGRKTSWLSTWFMWFYIIAKVFSKLFVLVSFLPKWILVFITIFKKKLMGTLISPCLNPKQFSEQCSA